MMVLDETAYWEDVAARYEKALKMIEAGSFDYLYEAQRFARETLLATEPGAFLTND